MNKSYLQKHYTRFRAYQLGNEGSSFSYYDGMKFTLIEARINEVNKPNILEELSSCGKSNIDTLHITSWDVDHCEKNDLEEILSYLKPSKVEYPGYDPNTDTAKECLSILKKYENLVEGAKIIRIDPSYIDSLDKAKSWGYANIYYHPRFISDNDNDNSTVKLFRGGSFNVLSLGDVESSVISASLRNRNSLQKEVDVMIVAHHGADNGFTSSIFLKKVRPEIAICSSNYDNKFDHPKIEIRELLNKYDIPLFTTKTGDIVIVSITPHDRRYKVYNLISGSEKISSTSEFISKKSRILDHNIDTVRNIFSGGHQPFRGHSH